MAQVEQRELAVIARGKVRPGDTDVWTNESLYVPPLPPTNLRGCHLISIQYDVYVSIISHSCLNELFIYLSLFLFCFFL